MTTAYQNWVNAIATNDAVIEAGAVVLTLRNWGKTAVASTIDAGQSTRAWWDSGASTETGHHGSWVSRQVCAIVYVAVALALQATWNYFAGGKAKAHWQLINDIVNDGVGIYGPSPMGDAVAAYVWGYQLQPTTSPVERAHNALAAVREYQAALPERMEEMAGTKTAEVISWAKARWPQLSA